MPDVGRVAVIGSGVVGACVGYYLAREGVNVLMVDAQRPGELTTRASLAWVNASAKAEHQAYFALNFAGCREYERLVGELPGASWWNPTGHLRWDYRDERELVDAVQQLRGRGYPAEVWEAGRVQTLLEPHVAFPSPAALVALFPSESWVDGPNLVRTLVDAAVEMGATTAFGSMLRKINVVGAAVSSIELGGGETYPVEKVVNAAGPGAAGVARLLGRVLPMRDSPGLAVRVQTSRDLVARVIHPTGIAIRPDGPGRVFLLVRSVEPALRKAGRASEQLGDEVKRIAAQTLPELARASVVETRVGYRPVPVDGFPAIGKAIDIDGYYEAVTHSGITLGPIVGRLLAAEIIHGDIDPLVSPFRASRFHSE
ncbi:MAG: FAD-binding oxidoreductase [Solirubrobacterales bacterium]|nr:FAD-binding oxidoreductase [Solirubrobacterales bacterium]MBV9536438.1 FAD-binding oxidoreductase [Solirubrobacterales bacterium]